MRKFLYPLLIVVLFATACAGSPANPSGAPTATVQAAEATATRCQGTYNGHTYDLAVGESTDLNDPDGVTRVECSETRTGFTFTPNTATPASEQPTAQPTETGPCLDGQMVLDELANQGSLLNRLMVGEAERVTVVHVSWPGEGFAGLDRVIVIAPRQGPVWQVFVKSGAYSIATRGFCGSNQEVADWADPAEVESLRRASADSDGEIPPVSEIGIYLLNYEERTLIVVKNAPDGPTPEEVLNHLELTFSENGNNANVPLAVAP